MMFGILSYSFGQEVIVGWDFPDGTPDLIADAGITENLDKEIATFGEAGDIQFKNGFTSMAAQATSCDTGDYIPLTTQGEILSEVDFPNMFIISEFFRCSCFKDTTFEQEVCTVGNAQGLVHIMISDEHANVLFDQLGDDVLYILHRDGVYTGKRLIEQYEVRINSECSGDLSSPSFSP